MYTPTSLFDAVVKELVASKGEVLVSTWFNDAEPVAINGGVFAIKTNNNVQRDTLQNRFTDNVSEIILELTGQALTPLYIYGEEDLMRWRMDNDDSAYGNYTFEQFIVGNSNKFAHAAAYAVSQKPASAYNPLFIYGQSGLGKTHLLYAIAGELLRNKKAYKIVYIKGEDFTNELVSAIQMGTMADFRERYRKADLLLVDDIQFIAGRVQTQEEFFHTFNAMYEAGKQIVLTSDRPPKEILTLEERLRTRFEWGLPADIQPPDLETRMALVQAKAQILGYTMPGTIVQHVAECITNNVRQLEGAVKKIIAMHSLMGLPLDLNLAQQAIRDLYKESPGLHPTPQLILDEVAAYYSVPAERIKGITRTKDIVLPRQIAMYLIREMTELSFPEIGTFLGGRDHTTIMYSVNKLTEQVPEDERLRASIEDMKQNIRNK